MWIRMILEGHPTEPQDIENGQQLIDNGKADACDPPKQKPRKVDKPKVTKQPKPAKEKEE